MTAKPKHSRLGIRFHQSFVPERHYISELLKFVCKDGRGNDKYISDETGIPTGKSSGKVPAIIKYCQGMGLIWQKRKNKERMLELTQWGKTVLKCDAYLSESLTQWLMHLHLCRRQNGAEIWYLTFGPGAEVLKNPFERQELEIYLSGIHGKRKRPLIGPLITTYTEAASLKHSGVLRIEAQSHIRRSPAPIMPSFGYGYAAFFLSLWEAHFPDTQQVTLNQFEDKSFWARTAGWNERQQEDALAMIRDKGAIEIDKQMRPWVLMRRKQSNDFWEKVYQDVI